MTSTAGNFKNSGKQPIGTSVLIRAVGIRDDVCAEDARDRARGAEFGHVAARCDRDLRDRTGDPAQQVERRKAGVTADVFDDRAEDEQEQHVEGNVPDARVQEHRADDRQGGERRTRRRQHDPVRDVVRNRREEFDEVIDVGRAEFPG